MFEGRDFIREKVRRRDNHTCQKCGRVWKPGERRLDVHHLDEELEGTAGFVYKNNSIDRLLTLCHRCHLNLPHLVGKMKGGRQRQQLPPSDRDIFILKCRANKMTLSAIGMELGITHQRVQQIVARLTSE